MHLDVVSRHITCEPGTSYYACGKGDFTGCCSKDPCTIGFCIDDPVFIPPEFESSSEYVRTLAPTPVPLDDDGMTSTQDSETSRTMTDSGTTHTIPNNSRVTVTKHTLIITDKAPSQTPSAEASSSNASDATGIPSSGASAVSSMETTGATSSPSIDSSGSPSTAVVAGAAVGGAIALGIVVFLALMLIRRKRLEKNSRHRSEPYVDIDFHHDNDSGEKALQPASPHNTGTKGNDDPFAPFGGRADKPDDPLRPPSGTFEMDGTSSAPAELPTENYNAQSSSSTPRPSSKTSQSNSTQPARTTDPRCNLNASMADRRQNTYVNHWNQYRNLGSDH